MGPSQLGDLDLLIARHRRAFFAENRAGFAPGRKFISPLRFQLWVKCNWLNWFACHEILNEPLRMRLLPIIWVPSGS